VREHDALHDRFVNAGVVQDEYADFKGFPK
jgi:hypothetical protein